VTAPKAITLKDVALEAGVSLSTVSQILNGRKRYSPDVEARVNAAAERLAYRPNPHARSMITGRTNTVGLVILDIGNPFFSAIISGANAECGARGYNLLLADAQVSAERERALHDTLAPSVDGLLLGSSTLADTELVALSARQPTVVIARDPGEGVQNVLNDARDTFYQLTRHLLAQGRRRIAYLNGPPLWTNRERRRGYLDALEEAGLQPLEAHLPNYQLEGGASLAPELLLQADAPDAVVAFDDLAAIGFMTMAQQLGFRVPEEVAVTGAGNLPLTDLIRPALTTVDLNSVELGRRAMELLLDTIEGNPGAGGAVLVKSRLVIRESARGNSGLTTAGLFSAASSSPVSSSAASSVGSKGKAQRAAGIAKAGPKR
jgi:LacI family transcriptional regulator